MVFSLERLRLRNSRTCTAVDDFSRLLRYQIFLVLTSGSHFDFDNSNMGFVDIGQRPQENPGGPPRKLKSDERK